MLDVNCRHNLLLAVSELVNYGTEEAEAVADKGKEVLKRR